jgi:4-hydroxy-2-oxoheptanedioate aldolase
MPGPQLLREATRLDGLWSVTGHPAVIDTVAAVKPDFVCIDTQHGIALGSLDMSAFTVLAYYGIPGLVRVPSVDPVAIGRALDLGAAGVIIPQVDTPADAEMAVAATRYMPRGRRSFGIQTRRVGAFDAAPYVVIQIETAPALDAVGEIAAVEGVDCLYIGPSDLGLSLGGPIAEVGAVLEGTAANASEMREAFERVMEACREHHVAPGVHCYGGANAARAHAMGFTVTSITSDLTLVASGLAAELAAARASV